MDTTNTPVVNEQTRTCAHDYEHAVRLAKHHYICPKCEADISLMVYLLWEARLADASQSA